MATDTLIKIKDAARKLFQQKGYAATRTRDIAEEAGVNLALVNYYFKSKELLFKEIMIESITQLRSLAYNFLNDDSENFEANLQRQVNIYTDFLLENPELPIFVMGELRNHPHNIVSIIDPHQLVIGSTFEKQMREYSDNPDLDVANIMLNGMSMMLFPILAAPMVKNLYGIDDDGLKQLINQRRTKIPEWIIKMIK